MLKSPSVVYFSAVTNSYPHAARALNWMLQQDAVPLQVATHPEYKTFVLLFGLINNTQQKNDFDMLVCL